MSANPQQAPACKICRTKPRAIKGYSFGQPTYTTRCADCSAARTLGPDRDIESLEAQRNIAFMDLIADQFARLGIDTARVLDIKQTIWREGMQAKQIAKLQIELQQARGA